MGFISRFNRKYPYYVILAMSLSTLSAYLDFNESCDNLEKVYEETIENTKEDIPELFAAYDEYTTLIAKEIEELYPNRDLIHDFAVYNNLLHLGFISLDDYTYYNTPDTFTALRGANIAIGNGVCLQQSFNLCDILVKLGYEAKVVYGTSWRSDSEKPDIYNHALVYAKGYGDELLIDSTNKTIFVKEKNCLYHSVTKKEDGTFLYFSATTHYYSSDLGNNYNYELLFDEVNEDNEEEIKDKLMSSFDDIKYDLLNYHVYEVKYLDEPERQIQAAFEKARKLANE